MSFGLSANPLYARPKTRNPKLSLYCTALVLLNQDTVSPRNWLEPLLDRMNTDPSIGIAVGPAHGTGADADALLDNADSAVSLARRQRCGYAFFD